MSKVDFVERAKNWLQSQLRAMACKVCQNYPSEIDIGDELDDIPSFAIIEHGRGCYTQSEDGGGESSVDVDEGVVIVAGLLAELEKNQASEHSDHANDPENALPLSAEILQASGLVYRDDCLWKVRGQEWELRVVSRGFVNVVAFGPTVEFDQYNQIDIGHIETVGDLRRLLEALHVPAVVTVPNGGE